jgi:lipid-A-disaccharide synthase-like uncharacterized protein
MATIEDSKIEWFSHSERVESGLPDTFYGVRFCATPALPQFVKRFKPHASAIAPQLIAHEAQVLKELGNRALPAPRVINATSTELVTSFNGVSLFTLNAVEHWRLSGHEMLALMGWCCQLAQKYAQNGVLPLDFWAGNILIPLSEVLTGYLRLDLVEFVDHAHSIYVGMNLLQPLWLRADTARIAPELQKHLVEDQKDLAQYFEKNDWSFIDATSNDPSKRAAFLQRFSDYEAPQRLVLAMNSGALNIDAALQFALGTEIRRGLGQGVFNDASLNDQQVTALIKLADKCCENQPEMRFGSLAEVEIEFDRLQAERPRLGRYEFKQLPLKAQPMRYGVDDGTILPGAFSCPPATPEKLHIQATVPAAKQSDSLGWLFPLVVGSAAAASTVFFLKF